jgi:ParB family chromosome partitioning protein
MSKFRILPVALLDEPERPARTEMSDELMESLVQSIKAIGILEPLLVRPVDDGRFEVVAGHRRLKAARIAGLADVPTIDLETGTLADAVKIHENLEREELSPSDEAIYYGELFELHGEDVDQVAALVKRTREHVEGRLNLLRGDKLVFDALAAGRISIGVANELNRFTSDDDRRYHLSYCERTGATVSTARQWRVDANRRRELESPAPAPASTTSPASSLSDPAAALERRMFAGAAPWELETSTDERPCKLCTTSSPAWKMLKIHVCAACAEHVLPRILAALQGREA